MDSQVGVVEFCDVFPRVVDHRDGFVADGQENVNGRQEIFLLALLDDFQVNVRLEVLAPHGDNKVCIRTVSSKQTNKRMFLIILLLWVPTKQK